MVSLNLIRTVVFGTATVFAILELALGAAITNFTTTKFNGGYFSFAALGIATAILTFCTLPLMLFLSNKRSGAIPSMIASEFAWTWFLWIMWLAVGGSTANIFGETNCNIRFDARLETLCREVQAFEAFGFLTWIILFAYSIILTYLVVSQITRGNAGIWTISIVHLGFDNQVQNAAPTSTGVVENKADANFAPQYPPMQSPVNSHATPNPNYASVGQDGMNVHSTGTGPATSPYPQV